MRKKHEQAAHRLKHKILPLTYEMILNITPNQGNKNNVT